MRAHDFGGWNEIAEDDVILGCDFPLTPVWSQWYSFREVIDNLRLGVRLITAGGGPHHPEFWTHRRLEYTWFIDEDSTRFTSFHTHTQGPFWYGGTGDLDGYDERFGSIPTPGQTPGQLEDLAPFLRFTFQAGAGGGVTGDQVEFRGLAINTHLLPCLGLDDFCLLGTGDGAAVANGVAEGAGFAFPPTVFHYDLDVLKNGGASLLADLTDSWLTVEQLHPVTGLPLTPQQPLITVPFDETFVAHNVSWQTSLKPAPGVLAFNIDTDWALAQVPVYDPLDMRVPIDANPAIGRVDTARTYESVRLQQLASISVQRPGGNRPSDWVTTDAALLTAAEGATDTTIQATGNGGALVRTFVQNWEIALQPPSALNPWFDLVSYRRTKWQTFAGPALQQDEWGGWMTYGWLSATITAPTSGAILLTVRGRHLGVYDPRVTGSDREAGFLTATFPYEVEYVIPLCTGLNQVWVDLLYPENLTAAEVPFYHGRVDEIELSGFQGGTYVLHALDLAARPSDAPPGRWPSVKYAPGVPRDRTEVEFPDWSALHASLSGAPFWWTLPDTTGKYYEWGHPVPFNVPITNPPIILGGAIPYVDELTGAVSGEILDSQFSASDMAALLDAIAGWENVHDPAAYAAANTDAFGASLAIEPADWIRDLVPEVRIEPGIDYRPPLGPRVRELKITHGTEFLVRVRFNVWGGVEAQMSEDGERAPRGVVWDLRDPNPPNAVLASATTDEDGFLIFTPVPTGTRLVNQSGQTIAYMLQHDRVRLDARGPSSARSPWNLETIRGSLRRVSRQAADLRHRRSPFVRTPWETDSLVKRGREPRIFWDHYRNRTRLLWVQPPDAVDRHDVYEAWSDDGGESFGGDRKLFVSMKHPAGECSPVTGLCVRAAWDGCAIQALAQEAGEQGLGDRFVFDDGTGGGLHAADDTFHIIPLLEGASRWLLAWRQRAGSYVEAWVSGDDCRSWEPWQGMAQIENGRFPTAVQNPVTGTVLLAALVNGELRMVRRETGEASSSGTFIPTAGGNPLRGREEQFSLAYAYEAPLRLALSIHLPATATAASRLVELESFDEGDSFREMP